MKYSVGDTVNIVVCNFNGLVVGAKLDGTEVQYEVSYPDKDGMPTSRWFWELELDKSTKEGMFGFRR